MINPIDVMFKAINLKYKVEYNNEITEMTYLELGTKLVLNNENIDKVIIKLKDD